MPRAREAGDVTTAEILAAVATWPLDWAEAHAERVAIKMDSGISEAAAIMQAWQEYRERAEAARSEP